MLLVWLLSAAPYLYGQSYQGLKIGDRLPEFTFSKILYGVEEKVTTADFKDRLLILDFWATTCPGCVAALPEMQRLQDEFGTQVKILPVTYEKSELVAAFWKKNVHTKALTLPTVVEDTLIKSYFPHIAIPHEVWVYKGRVIGITGPEYVDAFNIRAVLAGKIPAWPFKNDYYTFDGLRERLFKADHRQIDTGSTWLEYAAAGNYREKDGASAAGVFGSSGTVRDTAGKTVRTWLINQPLLVAYQINWMRAVQIGKLVKPSFATDPNQIVWDVKDPLKYMHRSPLTPDFKSGYNGDWMRKNAICFESVKADTGQSDADVARGVIADLDRLFELKVGWEKRKERVLVLVRTSAVQTGKRAKSKNAAIPASSVASGNSYSSKSVSELLYHLNQQPANPYVFKADNVAAEMPLNIRLSSWNDISAVRKALSLYGLDLKEEQRMVDKFVFKEVNKGLTEGNSTK